MGVNTTPPLPKSQPDVSKLNSFTGYQVTVTRQLAPRGTGQMVIPTQRMTKDKLLELQVSLPLQHGPGYYLFTVADEGGTGEDVWLTKLGPDIPQENQMPGPSPFPSAPVPGPSPLAPEVVQIMPGFFHHAGLGLLRTPWGKTIQWREGDPWPEAPAHTAAPATSTPWQGGWNSPNPQTPWYPGWGSYPVTDDSKEKRLEAELAEMRRQNDLSEARRREDRDREDARRREDERERREEQRAAETRKMFETLSAALTAKPTGPSEAERRLEAQLAEERRRREDQEREEARRREDQAREERWRLEQKAAEDRHAAVLKELERDRRDRPDPLMGLMTTIFTTQTQTALETARLNREAADRAAAATERHTQQLVETMRSDRSSTAETNRLMMESARDVMGMYREGAQFMIENQGGNNDPWYARAIMAATEKVGPAMNAIAARAQQQQQPVQPQYTPPAARQPPANRPVAPATTRPIPNVAAPAAPPSIAANTTGERPEGTVQDGDSFVVPGGPGHPGYRIPMEYVRQHGWTKTLAEIARQNAPSAVPIAEPSPPVASAMNGAATPGTTTVTTSNGTPLTVVPPPADSVPSAKPTKGRKKKAETSPAAPPPPPAVFVPPPVDPEQGYSGAELEAMSSEQALAIVSPFDDEALFGQLFSFVVDLRAKMPSPEETVEYILQGQAAGVAAPAMDLLRAKQLDALIERLLPGAPEEYQTAVVKTLAARLGLSVIEEEDEGEARA